MDETKKERNEVLENFILLIENAKLKNTLRTIANWDIPKALDKRTGEWHPYCVLYGSNGERDYVKRLAQQALDETKRKK